MKGNQAASWIKHDRIEEVIRRQIGVLHSWGPTDLALIDMHAGDAQGVASPQGGLFEDATSRATPAILYRAARELSSRHSVTLFLCETHWQERANLKKWIARLPDGGKMPNISIVLLKNNFSLIEVDWSVFGYALCVNDPNGLRAQNPEVMAMISRQIPRADFVVNVNVGAANRVAGVKRAQCGQDKYWWYPDPAQWCRRLGKSYALACGGRYGSRGLIGQIYLFTNWVSRKQPWKVVHDRRRLSHSPSSRRGSRRAPGQSAFDFSR